jgi:apolipoprotein N-acyltransferase
VSVDVEQARRQLLLSALALSAEPDLLVWAESAHPDTAGRMPFLAQGLIKLLARDGGRTDAVVGLVIETRDRRGERAYTNSTILLDGEGLRGRYDKRWLVPFGEYVPAGDVFFWVERLAGAVSSGFLSGADARPLSSRHGELGTSVCYEAIFPQQQRELVRNGAGLLVNVTNDAWFHGSPAPEQHLRFSALRAVETRRWVVRCANSGVTAVFAPNGALVGRIDEGLRGVLVTDVELSDELTLHARTGELPVWAAGLLTLAWALSRPRREEPEAAPEP